MVLSANRLGRNNKENVLAKTKTPLLRGKCTQLKIRRKRTGTGSYRTACLALRPARETARRTDVTLGPSVRSSFVETDGVEHKSVATTSRDAVAQRKVSLPRQLRRPTFRPISSAAISAINPDLSDVPIEYIHQQLLSVGEQMYATTKKITSKCPKGRLPHELEVVINDIGSEIPTHVFAVYSEPSVSQKQRVTLHPVHALVLAAQCAHLPPLPPSTSTTGNTNIITLPILPLRLPNPRTFTLLLAYLYTHRTTDLLSALLPISSTELSPSELSQKLADTCTISALLVFVSTTHGLWSNVAALGVFDDALWQALDHAWTALLGALAAQTRESSGVQ